MLNHFYFFGRQNRGCLYSVNLGRIPAATLNLIMSYDMYLRLHAYLVDKDPPFEPQRNVFPGNGLKTYRILAQMCGRPVAMRLVHRDIAVRYSTMVSGAAKPMRWERGRK